MEKSHDFSPLGGLDRRKEQIKGCSQCVMRADGLLDYLGGGEETEINSIFSDYIIFKYD